MSTPDILAAIASVIDAFEALSVPYSVAGSVASSAHGVARATLDIDLVADLRELHVDRLVAALLPTYYIDRDAALDAVRRRTMFNVVHLASMVKVDIYLLTGRPFDQESFQRRRGSALEEKAGARIFALDSPEDTVLHKLEWYRAGGEVSDRQWGDVIGVLELQGPALDLEYLRRWAAQLGILDLLERAMSSVRKTK